MTTQMAVSIPTIVYLTEADPFDQTQGASIKTLSTLKQLCGQYRVHVLFVRRSAKQTQATSKTIIKNLSIDSVYVPNIDTPIKHRLPWLLRNYLFGKPHHFTAYTSRDFAKHLSTCITNLQPKYFWADHVRLAQYWDNHQTIPLIIESHNIEWQLLYDCYRFSPKIGRWHFMIWLIEALLTKMQEIKYFKQAHTILAISNEDAHEIHRLSPNTTTLLYPPLLSAPQTIAHIQKRNMQTLSLFFVGNLDWYPNADALKFFITQIWYRLPHSQLSVELHVVGKDSSIYNFTELIGKQTVQKIFLHHAQPCLDSFYNQADIVILPFRIAGGVRMKALEAIQYHKPIITTPAGIKGLPIKELGCEPAWITANNPQAFALAIVKLKSTNQRQMLMGKTQYYQQAYQKWANDKARAIPYFNPINE